MRVFIVTVFACLNVFWLLFGLFQFPWFVPADNNPDLVRAAENSSIAGAWLLLLSLIATWLPTGVYGRGRLQLGLAMMLMAAWVGVTPWLYPNWAVSSYPVRFIAHLIGLIAIIAATWIACKSGKQAE